MAQHPPNVPHCSPAHLQQNMTAALQGWQLTSAVWVWRHRGQQVALDIARGLAYLHEKGVVHLDLKPANVLLAAEGTAKLADVGLARMLTDKSHLSQTQLGGVCSHKCPCPEAVAVWLLHSLGLSVLRAKAQGILLLAKS